MSIVTVQTLCVVVYTTVYINQNFVTFFTSYFFLSEARWVWGT